MINLSETRDLSLIADSWWDAFKVFLFEKKEGKNRPYFIYKGHRVYGDSVKCKLKKQAQLQLTENSRTIALSILEYFFKNCESIILCPPQELHLEAIKYLNLLRNGCTSKSEYEIVNGFCTNVFTWLYETFNSFQGYKTLGMLNVRSCPFCNRQYVITSIEARIRPDFDHFLPKSRYPLLAVSFYNLIPICSTCNKKKGNRMIRSNPYKDSLNAVFHVHKVGDPSVSSLAELSKLKENELYISLPTNSKDRKDNALVLGLEPVYNAHRYYVDSLIAKIYAYDRHARTTLVNDFSSSGSTEKDVLDFVWGPYFERSRQEEMPLSKLTADLLKQFDIIP